MNTGTCKLCLTVGADIRKSHIIPEFNYKEMYDEKHRFLHLSSAEPQRQRYMQKGVRERLLCQSCETLLSRWEMYAKGVFYDRELELVSQNQLGGVLKGIDYTLFRLYGLSLLWRMSASSLPMFSEVDLGLHEEIIRSALLSDDPLEPSQYPFVLNAVMVGGTFEAALTTAPMVSRQDGQHLYCLVIAGIQYVFLVGSHMPDDGFTRMAISRSGEIKIPIMEMGDIPYLRENMRELFEATED